MLLHSERYHGMSKMPAGAGAPDDPLGGSPSSEGRRRAPEGRRDRSNSAPLRGNARETRPGSRFSPACRTSLRVASIFRTDITDEVHRDFLLGEVITHFVPSSLARTERSARNRCAFTVPSFIPVTSAISRRSMSSTKRRRNTVRWRAGGRGGGPDRLYLLLDEGSRLRRLVPVRQGASEIRDVRAGVQHPPPELQAAAGLVIAHQVGRDLHEPCSDAGSAPKLVARLISLHEAILRQVLGGLPFPQGSQDKPEDSRPVKADQGIEILQPIRAVFARHGCQSGRPSSFHSNR